MQDKVLPASCFQGKQNQCTELLDLRISWEECKRMMQIESKKLPCQNYWQIPQLLHYYQASKSYHLLERTVMLLSQQLIEVQDRHQMNVREASMKHCFLKM